MSRYFFFKRKAETLKKNKRAASKISSKFGIGPKTTYTLSRKTSISKPSSFRQKIGFSTYVARNKFYFGKYFRAASKKYIEILRKRSGWKNIRAKNGLPANGQRTHTNGMTSKKRRLQ